ncbi:aldo/keto reductase [Orbus sturtevantii]|uniref:aldo/keto reductase n=1 Tax=Orbus sturtevantii TaxID=3074109 RepID=UPI00370D2BF4
MNYLKLGNSDLMVSRLCLGCMSFGDPASNMHAWTLNAEESETIIKHALDLGINFFDTANTYSAGTSETYLGRAIKKNIARDKVILATKVYFNEGNLSKKAILKEIEGSLQRLGTDYIDLYIIHRFDYNTPIEETMEILNNLVKQGKVRALGASAMYGYQFFNMQLIAHREGWAPFVSMQNHYNLLYREDERELIPICKQQNVALTPYSPLAAGRLSRPQWDARTLRSKTDKTAATKYDLTQDTDTHIAVRVKELSDKYGVTMTQIALAWLFAKGVTAPIIGATKEVYIDDAIKSLNISLLTEDIKYLEELYTPHSIVGAI